MFLEASHALPTSQSTKKKMLSFVNPMTLRIDQHVISLNNVTSQSNTRIKELITN